MNRTHFRYSLRKLNVGVASVLLGIGFGYGLMANQAGVRADTTPATPTVPTEQPQAPTGTVSAPTPGASTSTPTTSPNPAPQTPGNPTVTPTLGAADQTTPAALPGTT